MIAVDAGKEILMKVLDHIRNNCSVTGEINKNIIIYIYIYIYILIWQNILVNTGL